MTRPYPLRSTYQIGGFALLLAASLALAGCAAPATPPSVTDSPTSSPTPGLSPTIAPTQTPYVITATSAVDPVAAPIPQGVFILSLDDSARHHLFAFAPQSLPLTRLTTGNDDDITPAFSPDGTRVAFASNRNGYWDLYLLDLSSGQTSRLTDTPAYDGSPSWSPDNAWLAYSSYVDGNLEIFIRSVSDPAQLYRITTDPGMDTSPAWSPQGRQIAFVSNRSGQNEIWIADLDKVGDQRFVEISQTDGLVPSHPAWSADGQQLAWSATDPETGLTGIYVWNARTPSVPARWLASGDWPAWQDGSHLVTRLTTPNQTFLTGYTVPHGEIILPTVQLPGSLRGLTYGVTAARLPETFQAAAALTPAPAYIPVLSPQPNVPSGRASLEVLKGVRAPYPELHDLVDESFQALRSRVAADTGWDALGTLENAYVPLTAALDPGLGEDWLFTGRAFALNSSQLDAGWMVVVRQDFGQQTYWRVYIRAFAQDGSQGQPLDEFPWDYSARVGDPKAYDDGGKLLTSIPAGYWIDLSDLALQFGWERLPALTNWRSYFKGARFNEFAMTQGMDWRSAMLELYPAEVLVTPTVIIPPTRTPTRTPRWYQSPTPTRTPTPRPTYTP